RLKPKNREKIDKALNENTLDVLFNSNIVSINDHSALIQVENEEAYELPNDLVYIFAGGELPTRFLENIGIKITKRFGHILKSYK
ncbi:MAG: 4Fe-4S ferredoxin, partial [Muriicola sp.]